MKRLLLASIMAVCSLQAGAVVMTFDDISTGYSGDVGQYKGFVFNSTLDWISTDTQGAASGHYGMLNNNWLTGTIRAKNSADFTFDGVWVRTFSPNFVGMTGYIHGYNNGRQVWTAQTTISSLDFVYVAGMGGAIDELRLDVLPGLFYDDLVLNEPWNRYQDHSKTPNQLIEEANNPPSNPVPEPASLALAAVGLVGCGLARRRKKA